MIIGDEYPYLIPRRLNGRAHKFIRNSKPYSTFRIQAIYRLTRGLLCASRTGRHSAEPTDRRYRCKLVNGYRRHSNERCRRREMHRRNTIRREEGRFACRRSDSGRDRWRRRCAKSDSDLSDGLGADVIYDGVAGPGLEELIWATKRFGHVIVYGHLGAMKHETSLPLGACFLRGLNVHASFRIHNFTGYPKLGLPAKKDAVKRAKKFVFENLALARVVPKVDRVFSGLDEYAAAHRYMEMNAQIGRIVISLSE